MFGSNDFISTHVPHFNGEHHPSFGLRILTGLERNCYLLLIRCDGLWF